MGGSSGITHGPVLGRAPVGADFEKLLGGPPDPDLDLETEIVGTDQNGEAAAGS